METWKSPSIRSSVDAQKQHHVICYYEAGRRQRRYFSDFGRASAEADLIAQKLASGDLQALAPTGLDRQAISQPRS